MTILHGRAPNRRRSSPQIPLLHKAIMEFLCNDVQEGFNQVDQIIQAEFKRDPALINQLYRGYTPLGRAAKANNIKLLQLLIERGADPSCPGFVMVEKQASIENILLEHINPENYNLNDLFVIFSQDRKKSSLPTLPTELVIQAHEFSRNNLQAYRSILGFFASKLREEEKDDTPSQSIKLT